MAVSIFCSPTLEANQSHLYVQTTLDILMVNSELFIALSGEKEEEERKKKLKRRRRRRLYVCCM